MLRHHQWLEAAASFDLSGRRQAAGIRMFEREGIDDQVFGLLLGERAHHDLLSNGVPRGRSAQRASRKAR
jgi:hypothetical protein